MAEEIGVAVVGFGLAGRVFHAPFVSAVPGLRLEAIVQRTGDTAARAWPGARILRSIEDALDDAAVHLIVVATPNETHFKLAMRALARGKHVVVDKPIASSAAQARQMIDLAARQGVVLAPFHNRRWDGDFLTLRRLIRDGRLGRIVSLESHFDRFRPVPRAETWKEAAGEANGLLMDLGPHLLDQAMALFGPPVWVEADVRMDRADTGIDDAFDVTLGYPKMRVLCRSTMIAAEPSPRFLLHGTCGSYRKWGLDPQEPALVAGASVPRLGADEVWLDEDPREWGELVVAPDPARPKELDRETVPTLPGDYRGFYASVRDAILGRAPLPVTGEDGWRVLRLIELARESSVTGQRMPVAF